jgi:hypothetical protein
MQPIKQIVNTKQTKTLSLYPLIIDKYELDDMYKYANKFNFFSIYTVKQKFVSYVENNPFCQKYV